MGLRGFLICLALAAFFEGLHQWKLHRFAQRERRLLGDLKEME